MSDLVVDLDTPLPETLRIGKGNVLFVRGRCYHPDERLKALALTIDGERYPVRAHSMAAPEVLDGTVRVDELGHVLNSAFWGYIPIGPIDDDRTVIVGMDATLRSGEQRATALGRVDLVASAQQQPAGAPVLAACIATSDPDTDEITRTVGAVDAGWVLVDDHSSPAKFDALRACVPGSIRNDKRLGPVRTIERALSLAPDGARTVAIVDPSNVSQVDDAVRRLEHASAVIDRRSAIPLVVFDASLLSDVLPFPPDTGSFEVADWIERVASARGRVVTHGAPARKGRSFRLSRSTLVAAARNSATYVSISVTQSVVFAAVLALRVGKRASTGGVKPLAAVAGVRLLTAAFQMRGAQLLERRAAPVDRVASLDAQLAKIEHDIAPLRLDISETAPARLNVVVPMIDFRYVFGAYLTIFHLLMALRRRDVRTRLLIVQERPVDQARWRSELQRYPGLETLLDHVEIEDATDRSRAVEVNPKDAFLATTSWTAHVASAAATQLGRERFAFLVLEYDPLVHPTGSTRELSAQAYALPHDAIFSTELLRRYFRDTGIGAFERSVAIDNPIDIHETPPAMRNGLLFYARPEEHAARNLFEIGVLALRRVAARRDLHGWRIDGIGSLQPFRLALGSGVELNVLQRVPLDRYLETLESYDVGIALQATPHPGLVALDMAAAGLVTVTNAFATKRAEDLAAISGNLIAPEPTIDGVAAAIEQAIDRAGDVEARARGAQLNWPRTWDDALPIDEILALPSLQLR